VAELLEARAGSDREAASVTPSHVEVELAPLALRDIEEAAAFIAQGNPAVAKEFLVSIGRILERLSLGPEIGPRVLALNRGDIRAVPVSEFGSYRVFYVYDRERNRLRVLRVLHGARHWPALLAP
jgi:plasmid stabilization system protein ParE